MTNAEVAKLQGMELTGILADPAMKKQRNFIKAIGNTINVSVLSCLMHNVFSSTKLLDSPESLFVNVDTKQCFLADTGASLHSYPIDRLTPEEEKLMVKLPRPLGINTANGPVEVTHFIERGIRGIPDKIQCVLLRGTPPCLSVGMMVNDHGFEFVWRPGRGEHAPILCVYVCMCVCVYVFMRV